jgi:hypothetical protein
MRRSTIATLVATCAVAIGGLALPAAAPAATFGTSVTINFVDRPGPDIFRGRVMSPAPRCISDRNVRLFRVTPGADRFIDRDKSEDNGSWSIDVEGDPAPGDYYVRVVRKAIGADACAAAVSRTISVAG